MSLNTFVARNNISGGYLEFLYLPIDELSLKTSDDLIAPVIPGNNATYIRGDGGPNFLLNLGRQQITISVSGTIVDVPGAQYPTLTTTNRFIKNYKVVGSGTVSTADVLAQTIRTDVLDFWADQSTSSFSGYFFGWPDWGAGNDSTNNNLFYRGWEGYMRNPTFTEIAGEPNQFKYSFDWIVGDVS